MIQSAKTLIELEAVVVRFAGDSGDGMQLVGEQFTDSSALVGNDISTFPDFPAEIRAPQGTLPGVSGFQIQFGKTEILTPGDSPDALVAMNPAALKVNLPDLTHKGLLVINTDTFLPDNLRKAGYSQNPLEDGELSENFNVVKVDMTSLTKEALKDSPLKSSQKAQCKNFFALGFMYWVYGRPIEFTLKWINTKWAKKPEVAEANSKTLKAGYYYGETAEIGLPTYRIDKAPVEPGLYRKITGNEAVVIGLIAASESSKREIVFGSYPITPASSILEGLSRYKNFHVKTVQAEDEIGAIGIALGASFAGQLGVTGTSGPGICLKSEFMGLAVMTELPLVIIDVQRGGPSTGLPTKTEQGDLLQVLFGRNGESPMPVVAANSPADCFAAVIEAVRIALKYRTPVVLLSEGYIATGAEPWKIPRVQDLPELYVEEARAGEEYVTYRRDSKTLARKLAKPGTPGMEHRIGGLEKNESGGVSYDPANHERMVRQRAEKVKRIAHDLPPLLVNGPSAGGLLVLGWGGTYGAITTAVNRMQARQKKVSSLHLRHLNPLPLDLGEILSRFDKVLIPELNLGQLALLVRGRYLIDAISYSKVQGKPLTVGELESEIEKHL